MVERDNVFIGCMCVRVVRSGLVHQTYLQSYATGSRTVKVMYNPDTTH